MSASAAEAAANEAMAGGVSVSDTSDSATRAARTLPSVAASSKGSALRGDAATFVSGSSSSSNLKPTPPANSTNLSLHDTSDSNNGSSSNNNRTVGCCPVVTCVATRALAVTRTHLFFWFSKCTCFSIKDSAFY